MLIKMDSDNKTTMEWDLRDIGICTNGLNRIVFQDGRCYDITNFILISIEPHNKPEYFQLWGQWYPKDSEPISECIAGRIEEIKYFEVEYS